MLLLPKANLPLRILTWSIMIHHCHAFDALTAPNSDLSQKPWTGSRSKLRHLVWRSPCAARPDGAGALERHVCWIDPPRNPSGGGGRGRGEGAIRLPRADVRVLLGTPAGSIRSQRLLGGGGVGTGSTPTLPHVAQGRPSQCVPRRRKKLPIPCALRF